MLNFSFSKIPKAYFLILYAIITSVTIYFHESWRDEWQAILVSVHSQSIPQLFTLLKLEQHPPLWYLLVRFVWWIYPELVSVKILHILIAFTSAYILLYKIKYPFYYRLAFLFSYFLLYEYTIICRNYALVILFGLIAVMELQKPARNYLLLFIALAGMALSHVNGILLSLAFCFYFILTSKVNYRNTSFLIIISAYFMVVICTCILLHPQEHHVVISTKFNFFRLIRFFVAIPAYMWNVFVPVSEFKIGFWDSDLSDGDSNFINGIVISFLKLLKFETAAETVKYVCYGVKFFIFIPILYILINPLLKSYSIIFPLFLFWILLMLLQGFVYAGFLRHWGFYFISFVFFVFISGKEIPFLKYFLIANIYAGLFAVIMEIKYPFTNAKNVAESLNVLPDNSPILINNCMAISSIYGYLNKPVYYSDFKTKHIFTNWNQAYKDENITVSITTLLDSLQKEMAVTNVKQGVLILFIVNEQNKMALQNFQKSHSTLAVKKFYNSLSGENFATISLRRN